MKKAVSIFTVMLITVTLFGVLMAPVSPVAAQEGGGEELPPVSQPGGDYFVPPPLVSEMSLDGKTIEHGVPARIVIADPDKPVDQRYIPAPEFGVGEKALSTINISYYSAGQSDPWGQACYTFPTAAKTAFNAAATIWENTLQSSVPITIKACWGSLSGGTLGYSGGGPIHRDFSGAKRANTWYMGTLANKLHGSDLSANPDMYITYNKNFSWYYGTSGAVPSSQHDLMTVVLHEIGHGLNFAGSMTVSGSTGSYGYGGSPAYPNIYDVYMKNSSGTSLTSLGSGTTALGSALRSNGVYFHGSNAMSANGGGRVKMYAPSTWMPGSSYSHFDYSTFNDTANELMVYAISAGEAIHNPGPIAKGLLKDIGWTVGGSTPTVPTLISPSGTIYDTTPTYKWTKITGATSYQVQVYRGTTKVVDKVYSSSYCSGSYCQVTPSTTLLKTAHKWRVRAYKSGWKSYSAYKSFTVTAPATGFNSQFTSNATGWTPVYGSWGVGSGYYKTYGVAGKFASTAHSNIYTTSTYQAKMKRLGCSTCANTLVMRGTASPLDSTYRLWNKGYLFEYTNNGYYSVWKKAAGVYTAMKGWTTTSYVNSGSWNTLMVKASGSTFRFYLNGHLVYTGSNTSYPSGKVGLAMYRDTSSTGNAFYVDWATLVTTVTSSELDEDEVAEEGMEYPNWDNPYMGPPTP